MPSAARLGDQALTEAGALVFVLATLVRFV